ncbi:hypothetical protein [Rhodococcus sp. NPDC058521]|uniref:hypothetical protein n=1 Tax=Rhodococcus sp. NPDC058521 TaxID=3346536 RepID=UPI00365B13FC
MATTHYEATGHDSRSPGVYLAGTRWPLYKIEAIAVGVLVLVGCLAIIGSFEPAVLTAAAAAVVVWWARRTHLSRKSGGI